MRINEFMARRRKQLNLTLEEVADSVGVRKGTVAKWESGEIANMKRDKIQLIARVLKCSPLILMENEVDDSILNIGPVYITDQRVEKKDIQERLSSLLGELSPDVGIAFYNGNEKMDDETKELMFTSIKNALELSKTLAAQRDKRNDDQEDRK